ncbi:MAG: Transcriptional regulator containing an amidase domain and an AraC-type DNA-binding HTH domain [Rhodobacteraceae bacterium HLUCCA12]|nr:MAG: Transcriptional regulator containing an amidase domain and an AraC-type DNA-binding HTH domain [Rhodobacteraceae bacterium HLUCCA12]
MVTASLSRLPGHCFSTCHAILPLSRPHSEGLVHRVEDYLTANFHRDVPTDEIAALVGMSRRNLVRRFKAATGARPGDYVQMLRVAAARSILEYAASSIERVGLTADYKDMAYFRQVFKRHSGMTPAAYRDQFRRSGSPGD